MPDIFNGTLREEIMSIALLVITIAVAVLGALAGFFRKYTRISVWGPTVALTILLLKLVASIVKKEPGKNTFGIAMLVATVVLIILFTLLLGALKKGVAKGAASKAVYSHYKNTDDREENEEYILQAVDANDKKQYKKQLKKSRKIKDSTGGWGITDRLLGLVSGAVNAVMIVGTIIIAVLLFSDFSRISFLTDLFGDVLTSNAWTTFGYSVALDVLLIGALTGIVRTGYKGGICSVISLVVILGMVVGFAFASWSIAGSDACAGAVEGLKNGLLSGISGTLGSLSDTIAKVILALFIFLLSLILVVLVGIFLPKLLNKLKEGKVFSVIDGVFGAIVMTAIILAILIVVGAIAYTLNDLEFMAKLNEYNKLSNFSDAIYTYNPLGGVFDGLPIHDWFAGNAG